MIHLKGRLEVNEQRGVFYFWDETGVCRLRIEGLKGVPIDATIEIHLAEPGCTHHHKTCGKVMTEDGFKRVDQSVICAVKLEEKR